MLDSEMVLRVHIMVLSSEVKMQRTTPPFLHTSSWYSA